MVGFKGAVLIGFLPPRGRALIWVCGLCSASRPLRKVPLKFHHSFIPLLAPPEDSKYFNSKGGQCFCNADLRRGIWGQAGEVGWQ